jgi:exo-beta-1,3-glucanase (GH17 family)
LVDQNGNPVSTSTEYNNVAVETAAPQASQATAGATTGPQAEVAVENKAAVASPQGGSSTSSSGGSSNSGSGGYGITYNAYNKDGTCKSADQVMSDFSGFASGYSVIRTYGVDCNTVPNVLAACKANGLKLFQGIFDITAVGSAVSTIVAAAGGDWSAFDTISVGNELVNSGQFDAKTVVAAVTNARSLLRAAGYTGPVVTVDTLVATLANPSLCDSSDYCAVNSHPFFDGNVAAVQAGDFLTTHIKNLRGVLSNSGQTIVITETGWPSQGLSNGVAIPSKENQVVAVSSIKSAFSSNPAGVILFNSYNMYWKHSSASQFDAEPYWGIHGDCPSG